MSRMDELLGTTAPKPFGAGHVVLEVHIRLKCPTCRCCLIHKTITRYVWVCSTCGRDRRHGLWGRRLSKLHAQYLTGQRLLSIPAMYADFGVAHPVSRDFFEVNPEVQPPRITVEEIAPISREEFAKLLMSAADLHHVSSPFLEAMGTELRRVTDDQLCAIEVTEPAVNPPWIGPNSYLTPRTREEEDRMKQVVEGKWPECAVGPLTTQREREREAKKPS